MLQRRQSRQKRSSASSSRARARAEYAGAFQGLQDATEADEQILAFARGKIAGGARGRLNLGPETFFAPLVNIALTDRRLLLQHVQPETLRPSTIPPHTFPLADIAAVQHMEIETFGADAACRLVVRLAGDQYCRLRLRGDLNCSGAKTLARVFSAIAGERNNGGPARRCGRCRQALDQPYPFCPYCGVADPESAGAASGPSAPEAQAEEAAAEDEDPQLSRPAAGIGWRQLARIRSSHTSWPFLSSESFVQESREKEDRAPAGRAGKPEANHHSVSTIGSGATLAHADESRPDGEPGWRRPSSEAGEAESRCGGSQQEPDERYAGSRHEEV